LLRQNKIDRSSILSLHRWKIGIILFKVCHPLVRN
jgi:hypothetical protein